MTATGVEVGALAVGAGEGVAAAGAAVAVGAANRALDVADAAAADGVSSRSGVAVVPSTAPDGAGPMTATRSSTMPRPATTTAPSRSRVARGLRRCTEVVGVSPETTSRVGAATGGTTGASGSSVVVGPPIRRRMSACSRACRRSMRRWRAVVVSSPRVRRIPYIATEPSMTSRPVATSRRPAGVRARMTTTRASPMTTAARGIRSFNGPVRRLHGPGTVRRMLAERPASSRRGSVERQRLTTNASTSTRPSPRTRISSLWLANPRWAANASCWYCVVEAWRSTVRWYLPSR